MLAEPGALRGTQGRSRAVRRQYRHAAARRRPAAPAGARGRLSQLRFDLVDRPGQLPPWSPLSNAGANIVEVSHQRIFTDLPAKATLLEVVIETRDRAHLTDTIEALRAAGLDVEVGGK